MFLGRDTEQTYLENFYHKRGSHLVVLYGQKNIGKTALIHEFTKGKDCLYFMAREVSEQEQQRVMKRELLEQKKVSKNCKESFEAIFFQYIETDSSEKKILIVEEFQNIVRMGNGFMEAIQKILTTNVLCILSSSSVSWVENSMIQKLGNAAHDISGFLKVRELPFQDLVHNFPKFTMEQCVQVYAILGGVPGLWQYFSDDLSIEENICNSILKKGCFLHDIGRQYLVKELREVNVYATILSALSEGEWKLNELYARTGFSRAKISVYLKNLMELEIVEKVFSINTPDNENVQKGMYRIQNHAIQFWFRYIYYNLSRIENVSTQEFYQYFIAPTLSEYCEEFFGKICREYIEVWNQDGKLPITCEKTGFWVGKVGTIDIVAKSRTGESIVGLCNWKIPVMRYEDYEWMLFCAQKAGLMPSHIFLFSIGTFDEKISLEAKVKQNIQLVDLSML